MTSSSDSIGDLNSAALPEGREEIACMIVKAFADAGFGRPQQLAALANAIAESNLNPEAVSAPPEQAVGLFQLNSVAGLGTGHTVAELEDPATNINIVLSAARKFDDFAKASSLEDAVSIFVHKIERPANPSAEVARRLEIAERLEQTT